MRDDVLDIMKGIGIILVVLGHSFGQTVEGITSSVIYTFHMPLFFIVAGFLAYGRIDHGWIWIKKKFLHLVIPFITGNIIWFYATAMDPSGFFYQSSLWNWIKVTIQLGNGNWFLWTLFACFVVLALIDWLWSKDNRWMSIIVTIIVIVITLGLPADISNWFGYRRLSWFFLFLFAGYVLARYKDRLSGLGWVAWLSGLVGCPLLLVVFGVFTPEPENFNYWFGERYDVSVLVLAYAKAFCGTSLIFILSDLLVRAEKIKSMLTYIGTLTLGIFIFSGVGENIFLWLCSIGVIERDTVLGALVCFIVSGFVGWLLTILIKKYYITNAILLGDTVSFNRLREEIFFWRSK